MYRAPQRSYTPTSLEAWFARLTTEWEGWFAEDEVKWGQTFYRNNQARSTELLDDSAIIHFGSRKDEVYIIVDWDLDKPSFRISHPDFGPGVGLGIAGLYELEEFLADELPAVSELDDTAKKIQPDRPVEVVAKEERPKEAAQKFLKAHFHATDKGIKMRTTWEDQEGKVLSNVKMRDMNSSERESFIRLTTLAHRSGFNHAENSTVSYLTDPSGVQVFLAQGIARWRRQLKVYVDPQLESWRRGIRDLAPELKVDADHGVGARYQWDFSLNGDSLDEADRLRIFKNANHVHFLPGRGIVRLNEASQVAIHEWKSSGYAKEDGELPRYLMFSFLGSDGVGLDLSSEMKAWRDQVEHAPISLGNFSPILRPYQKDGVTWLANILENGCHALLADEMGLGKTLQVLTLLEKRGQLNGKLGLIVCPSSVVPVWQAEINDKFKGTVVNVLSKKNPFDREKSSIWISSYSQLRRHKSAIIAAEFETVILDEAQTIKNPDAKTTQACFAIRGKNRIVLTGTPIENRPLDLWTLFRFLMPGLLGSRHYFTTRLKEEGSEFQNLVRRQIEPFILRRTKRKVLTELPPKVVVNWRCPLSSQQKRMYREIAERGISEFGGEIETHLSERSMHFFSLLTRLRQVCCDPSLVTKVTGDWRHSGKIVSMISRLEEAVANGSKVVIFSQFVEFLKRIRVAIDDTFENLPVHELTGSTLDRSKPVNAFQESKEASVFLVSLKAGGTGLNLQSADYVFLMDPWWNPAVEAQAIDRVHRFGQKNKVFVYRYLTSGTIEERIEELKGSKQELFDQMLSDMDEPKSIFQHFKSVKDLIGSQFEETNDD